MSFKDGDYGQKFRQGNKRRVQRVCDACRRRKSRCDGWQISEDKCTKCRDAGFDCTYFEYIANSPTPKSYVDSLEARLEQSEALVRKLRAELANAQSSNNSPNSPLANSSTYSTSADSNLSKTAASMVVMGTMLRSLAAPPPPPHPDDLVHLETSRKLVGLLRERRFIGKSSGAVLMNNAIDLKENLKCEERQVALGYHSVEDGAGSGGPFTWPSRRLQYWHWKPNTTHRTHTYNFPSQACISQFIELYFTHQNMYIPLLHRPTFERNIAEGLHLRNDGFASTVLLVCAIASRWATDAAITGVDLACGWEWFDQVPPMEDRLFEQATLYDLQYYCLAVEFLDGSSAPLACWTLIGVGLRLAQDIGCHRRSARIEVPSVERELYKRAFWVLVYWDRTLSSHTGRPCAIHFDDFDIDLPIECDDEYWEHPTHPFKQPAGVPSRVTFFNTLIGLHHILAFILKTLYGLDKMRVYVVMDNAQHAVAEFDSALNNWRERVPEHLRWNATRQDPVFFDQSVALHCSYYHLQILIHRPFIPMLHKSPPTALPSLAICTNAARAIAGMVDVQRRRKPSVPVAINLRAVFTAGIILLLNVLSRKRTGLMPDLEPEVVNVHKCMIVTRLCEHRWQTAGILWDILAELASVSQLPLPVYNHDELAGSKNNWHSTVNGNGTDATHPPLPHDVYPLTPEDDFYISQTFGCALMEPSVFARTTVPKTSFPPVNPHAQYTTDPMQASRELGEMMNLIDSDTIAMWTNAPLGLEVDDWGNYFYNFSELNQGQQAAHGN